MNSYDVWILMSCGLRFLHVMNIVHLPQVFLDKILCLDTCYHSSITYTSLIGQALVSRILSHLSCAWLFHFVILFCFLGWLAYSTLKCVFFLLSVSAQAIVAHRFSSLRCVASSCFESSWCAILFSHFCLWCVLVRIRKFLLYFVVVTLSNYWFDLHCLLCIDLRWHRLFLWEIYGELSWFVF